MKNKRPVELKQILKHIQVSNRSTYFYGRLRVRVTNCRTNKDNIFYVTAKLSSSEGITEVKRYLSLMIKEHLDSKRRSYTKIKPIRGEKI